ncbi:hypothetical protein REPUB_Repub09cG0097000 [Reevesia pubescens]
MSFRGKRKDGEYHLSDENEVHAPPQKASKSSSAAVDSDDSDAIVVCEISKNRRVSVRNWNGKIWVDIREFYLKDGKQLPGKKGSFKKNEKKNQTFMISSCAVFRSSFLQTCLCFLRLVESSSCWVIFVVHVIGLFFSNVLNLNLQGNVK